MLFSFVHFSPSQSPPAGNESHQEKVSRFSRFQGFKVSKFRRLIMNEGATCEAPRVPKVLPHKKNYEITKLQNYEIAKLQNYKFPLKCSHPAAASRRAFPSAPINRIPADCVVRPIRVTRTPSTSEGIAAADVNSNS